MTDVCTLQEGRLLRWVELVRRVEGVRVTVRLAWRLTPRFDFGRAPARWRRERGHPVARGTRSAVTLLVDGTTPPAASRSPATARWPAT